MNIRTYVCLLSITCVRMCIIYTQTELNYMSPSNLEFKEALGNCMRKFDVDHDVQYQEVAENQKYTSIL